MRMQADYDEHGFSLVEALAAVLVLSIAAIGAASLQLVSLRTSHQSGLYTHALHIASEMADKLRSAVAYEAGAAGNEYAESDSHVTGTVSIGSTQCYGASANCDALAMADFDWQEAEEKVKVLLPQGRVKICRDTFPWKSSSGQYQWECAPAGKNSVTVIKLGWLEHEKKDTAVIISNEKDRPKLVLMVPP